MNRSNSFIALTFLTVFLVFETVDAQVLKTKEAALQEAFADCDTVVRKVVFLTDEQVAAIEHEARAKVVSKVVTYYLGTRHDTTAGLAFFETTKVRTKPATFMIVVRPDGVIDHVQMLAFYEPFDYLPATNWLALFRQKVLDNDLWPQRGIHGISGATLTVRAITKGVRKMLATYQIAIQGRE